MIRDSVRHKGVVDIVLTDEAGLVKKKLTVDNLVVQTGRNFITHRMAGAGNAIMSHMGIGETGTAAALSDTTLGSEAARVTLTSTTVNANTIVYAATFNPNTPAVSSAITEAGIFNASSGGEMLCRTSFAVINKTTVDSLTITWTITNS